MFCAGRLRYNGAIHAFRSIIKREGFGGLYRGEVCLLRDAPQAHPQHGVNVLSDPQAWAPTSSVSLPRRPSSWQQTISCARCVCRRFGQGCHQARAQPHSNPCETLVRMKRTPPPPFHPARQIFVERNGGKPIQLWQELLAGCGAGFVQVVATNPMEIVKIRLQLQGTDPTAKRMSPVEVVRHLGIRGLYKGSLATLIRDVPFSAVFFPLYANLQSLIGGKDPGVAATLAAGCISGAAASGACTPADVIKTRLQVKGGMMKYGGIAGCLRTILAEEGVAALFKGVGPRMMVVAPLFGISLLAFEVQKSIMTERLSKHAERE